MKKNGKNYDEVTEWMKRMTATTINAAVYLAGRKVWVEDTFHVFDRVVGKGMDLGDGRLADMNYVWLAPWQRENIAANYQIPIDFEVYCRLRNHIAKALVPLLQIWLYTSIRRGRFEKAYADFCQLLNIRRYEHLSKIKEVLAPSFDELAQVGYLASWTIEPRTLTDDFKISLTHGAKFFGDRELRVFGPKPESAVADCWRSWACAACRRRWRGNFWLHSRRPAGPGPVGVGRLSHAESRAGTFRNPAGFYVYLLRNGVLPPREFETSRTRAIRQERQISGSNASLRRLELENEYAEYRLARSRRSGPVIPERAFTEKLAELHHEIRSQTPEADGWLPVRLRRSPYRS